VSDGGEDAEVDTPLRKQDVIGDVNHGLIRVVVVQGALIESSGSRPTKTPDDLSVNVPELMI
jgi:hypothetical protein